MPPDTPIAASRFGISMDGVQIGSFSELQGISTKVDPHHASSPQGMQHLAQFVQRNTGKRGVTFRLKKPNGPMASQRIRQGKTVEITAYDRMGAPVFAISGRAKGVDQDVLQQEWSIVYETIQRVI